MRSHMCVRTFGHHVMASVASAPGPPTHLCQGDVGKLLDDGQNDQILNLEIARVVGLVHRETGHCEGRVILHEAGAMSTQRAV